MQLGLKTKNIFFSLTKEIRRVYQPKRKQVESWVKSSLSRAYHNVSINIVIVSQERSQELNLAYRGMDKPTNVISLAYPDSNIAGYHALLGEIILCDAVIIDEAKLQKKSIIEHYAHMIIHGMLHLQGYDHITDEDAQSMETLEISIMKILGFNNPYTY